MAGKFKACSVVGCNRNAHWSAKGRTGHCNAHYQRILRHGSPTLGRTPKGEPLSFVENIALKHEGNDCLIWPYNKNDGGYGHIVIDGRTEPVHRYICKIVHGEPPTPDHESAHSCGNGHLSCISPWHLSWKTRKENSADRVAHDTHARGERCKTSKLKSDQVLAIRKMRGAKTATQLARQFSVSKPAIDAVWARRSWDWLD